MNYSAYRLKWQLFIFNFKNCNKREINKFRRLIKSNFLHFNYYNRTFITHSKTEANKIQIIAPKGCEYHRIEITDKQFSMIEHTHKTTDKETEEFFEGEKK